MGDRMIIARRPDIRAKPSPAQLAVREKYKMAATYARAALADPISLALYQAAAKAKGVPAFAFALGDFLNAPEVKTIDATGYHGDIGDVIKVSAIDDVGTVPVQRLDRGFHAAIAF